MIGRLGLALLLLPVAPVAAHAFGTPVTDRELATMRGGIHLPDGTDVAIGVAIETQINGIVALRTQFSTLQPGVQVFAGGQPATAAGTVMTGGSTLPIVTYDRNAAGTTITVAPVSDATALNISGSGSLPPPSGAPLALQPNAAPVATALGSVALRATSGSFTAELTGNGFDVQQMIGRATGAVVQNTVNNQSITTATWISIDLHGVAVPANLASTLASAARAVGVR